MYNVSNDIGNRTYSIVIYRIIVVFYTLLLFIHYLYNHKLTFYATFYVTIYCLRKREEEKQEAKGGAPKKGWWKSPPKIFIYKI